MGMRLCVFNELVNYVGGAIDMVLTDDHQSDAGDKQGVLSFVGYLLLIGNTLVTVG